MNFNNMANANIINLNEITYNKFTAIIIDLTVIFSVSNIPVFLYFLCGVYSWFLFAVMFYKVMMNIELANTESLFLGQVSWHNIFINHSKHNLVL